MPWGDEPANFSSVASVCQTAWSSGSYPYSCDGICDYMLSTTACLVVPLPVGSFPLGDGRWGQADLMGYRGEWVSDAWVKDRSMLSRRNPLAIAEEANEERTGRGTMTNRWLDRREDGGGVPSGIRCARDGL